MKRFLFLITLILGLVGCTGSDWDKKPVSRVTKQYELLSIQGPRIIKITLRDIETGTIAKKLYVAQSCKALKKARIGEILTFDEVTYVDSAGEYSTSIKVKGFCDLLKKRL